MVAAVSAALIWLQITEFDLGLVLEVFLLYHCLNSLEVSLENISLSVDVGLALTANACGGPIVISSVLMPDFMDLVLFCRLLCSPVLLCLRCQQ